MTSGLMWNRRARPEAPVHEPVRPVGESGEPEEREDAGEENQAGTPARRRLRTAPEVRAFRRATLTEDGARKRPSSRRKSWQDRPKRGSETHNTPRPHGTRCAQRSGSAHRRTCKGRTAVERRSPTGIAAREGPRNCTSLSGQITDTAGTPIFRPARAGAHRSGTARHPSPSGTFRFRLALPSAQPPGSSTVTSAWRVARPESRVATQPFVLNVCRHDERHHHVAVGQPNHAASSSASIFCTVSAVTSSLPEQTRSRCGASCGALRRSRRAPPRQRPDGQPVDSGAHAAALRLGERHGRRIESGSRLIVSLIGSSG